MIRALAARAAVLLVAAAFVSCGSPVKKYTLHFPEEHATLGSNGMRVIVLPDPSTPLVEVDVRYEVGSKEDPPGKGGIAHLAEHIMFQQKPAGDELPELFKVLQQIALYFNAYTAPDTTHYQVLVRKEELESVLAIEAARMYMGCKSVSVEQFEREREVVRNEYRLRMGSPEGLAYATLHAATYPEGHAYHTIGIGTDPEIAGTTLEDVCKFLEDFYTPSRATLIIAGNVTTEELEPLIAKYFGGIPKREPKPLKQVQPIELKKKRIDLELDVDETSVNVIFAAPPRFSDDDAAAVTLAAIVASIVRSEGDEWDFATGSNIIPLGGAYAPAWAISVSVRSDGDVGKALDAIWRANKRAYKFFEEGDYQSTKNETARAKASYVMRFEDLSQRTDLYGDYQQFAPDRGYLAGDLKRLDDIDYDRMKSYAKRALDPERAVVVVIHAKKGAKRHDKRSAQKYSPKSGDDRSGVLVDPAEARHKLDIPASQVVTGEIRRFTMGNGMKVVLQPTKSSLPVMTVQLRFGVGSAHESPKQAGLASIAASSLMPPMGDAGRGGQLESANVLGEIGAEYSASAGADGTVFTVRGLNIYDGVIIKGLERWVKIGDYNQEGLERRRKYYEIALKRSKTLRAQLAYGRAMAEAIYGADHPYANTGQATLKSLGSIGRDAAYDFKSKHYSAKNATLVVAGNFDPAQVERYIKDNFGDWGGGHEDKPVSSALPARQGAINLCVENEDVLAVTVQIAYPAPSGMDGQYGARLILAEMISKRMAVLREELGVSYGAGARYSRRTGPGSYNIGGPVDGERAGEALARMRAEIEGLRQHGEHFDEAFVVARRIVLRDLITQSGASYEVAAQLLTIATFGLADNYYEKLVRQVAAASPEQVKALIESELRPELEVVGVLGTKQQCENAFAGAGLTMTKFVETDKVE